ncbi:cytoplasmic dynein 2 heavy chain 1-like [Photinus pyralis]|uniref:cytoplasmic dynein 2 heavy chain 1-like n=1 Tax=Photinus pyralis TaxID=7054 RepID=UPI0012675520|nr:cytoplasmic dynein 2 heavy chain 1-like [Photinus pyralis]
MKIVMMMTTVYNEVVKQFNLVEGHYDFSLNELTRWCRGILMYKEGDKDAEEYLLEIVVYEALRLFQDRLVNENHRAQFEDILREQLKMQWNKAGLLQDCKRHVFVPVPKVVASPHVSLLHKQGVEEWTDVVKKGIVQYEREGDVLEVLVIPELVQLTAKIAKALVEPGGNVLLIGVAGVGRKPSVKIISALLSVKLVAPIFSNYPQFNNELKMAIQHAAVEGEETFLLLEDSNLNDKRVVDTVSAMLCSGEVPGLYTFAELESLAAGLKDEAGRASYDGSLIDFFTERIKKKLHLVICIESNNTKFSELLSNCPALYTHCNVIWTSEWGKDTLESIPSMLIESENKSKIKKATVDLVDGFFEIHGMVKQSIAIPSRFISFVKTYIEVFSDKVNVISERQGKLQAGVTKLTDAKNVVDELKLKAKEQQDKLSQKQEKANAALEMISSTMKNANTQKHEMEKLKQHTEKESVFLAKRKEEIEEELSEVKPLIDAARTAVGNIKTESLSEIRSLRAPPDIIRDILEGVLRLMGTQDTSWNSMKNFLSKRGVKEDIRSFDASRITSENREAVSRLLANRKDSFDPKNAKRASVAAAPLAAWVTANVRYSTVIENIKPLEREQNKLKQNLATAELQLTELSSGLMDVDTAVAKLKNQLSTYTKEAAEIEINLNAARDTLNSAEGLINKLNDEYERWKIQLKEFSDELKMLPTNSLLASAFITYLPGESEDSRIVILEKWQEVLGATKFSLEEFLGSEREQLQWQTEGLPADQLSLQNAVIILNTSVTPLFLDPSSIASDWIKAHLKSKTVEIVSQDSPKFNTVLELAIRFGKFLIIEEVETISPTLFPILRKQFVDQGDRKSVHLNGKLVDYHNDFKLILSCRNAQLQLSADLAAVVNVVNFTTTHAGLSEQLLMSAIKQDSPELETRRKDLLRQREELQEKQYNLQNRLLEDLANASGDILQNKNLMVSLNETKASSSAIATALVESEGLHRKLQEEYDVYKEIASFASALYFAIDEFANANVLYSLSVPAFIRLFLKSLPQLKEVPRYLKGFGPGEVLHLEDQSFGFVQRTLIQAVYGYMSRAIFKADRLKFALHLCHKILPREIPSDEWNFFIGNSFIGKIDKGQSVPEWIPESVSRNVAALQVSRVS